MNISNGHNGAQGHTLPEKHNTGAFAYGLSEDSFGKLTRAKNACDMLQLLFSEYPSQAGALDAGCAHGVAALMEYLLADLTDITHSCALIEGGAR
ncbi:hypothetical protein HEN24_017180 [Escherichia coli]|uniref:hypothetical protein n=1 Tax=Escherichia coli TaxID=562 RepID=UPI00179B9302|nr:hypothetical protein [Escherichia coli]